MNPYSTGERIKVFGNVIVTLSFYTEAGETIIWDDMPQVPVVSHWLHYTLTGNPDDARVWRIIAITWVKDEYGWHVEIGLT